MDLTDAVDIGSIQTAFVDLVASNNDIDHEAVDAISNKTATAVKNVNTLLSNINIDEWDPSEPTTAFSTTQVLVQQVKAAATAEKDSPGTGSISFESDDAVKAAAANAVPTDIDLSATSIGEHAKSLVVGVLTTTDADQPDGEAFIYKIEQVKDTDYDAFTLDPETGELALKAQPDFETKSSYEVVISSTDAGGKTYSKTFEIKVEDENDAPVGVADTVSATEDAAVTYTAATLLGNDTDADGDPLSIKSVTSGTGGTVVLNKDGTVTFTPTANFAGVASFSYIATDDVADTAVTKVNVNVAERGDAAVKLVVDVTALDGLGAVIDSDVTAAAKKVSSFYNDKDAGALSLLDAIDFNSFRDALQLGDVQVSSGGIRVTNAYDYTIALDYLNFSPTSLSDLQDVFDAFNGSVSDLTISGGFKSLSLLNPGGSTIVSLSHGDDGITWSNPNISSGGVDSFVIEGNFNNQIQNYLSVLSQIQTDVADPDNNAASDIFLTAYNSLTDLVQFEGISARIDGKDLISIRGDASGEQSTITIAGEKGDHEITLGVAGSAEFANGLIEAAGGITEFVDLLMNGGSVFAEADNNDESYLEWTALGGNEQYANISDQHTTAWDYIFEDPYGQFIETPDLSTWSSVTYSSDFNYDLSYEEYTYLKGIIEGVQAYLDATPSPLDDLGFSFNYAYAGDDVISFNATNITSLIPDQDTENSVFLASTDSDGNDITTIIDGNDRISLSLVGVEKTEFDATLADYDNDLGATIDYFLDVFVDYSSQTILATPETV